MSAEIRSGLLAALPLASALAATSAVASDGSSWPRFPGSAYASQGDPADRTFIKEWEATPPKGYPTLSPANIAAMKAAIKQYAEVAAARGWQPLPDVKLQQGMSHPAVALLRQGVSPLDTVEQTGYTDQPHLTRSLKRLIGQTPTQLAPESRQASNALPLSFSSVIEPAG